MLGNLKILNIKNVNILWYRKNNSGDIFKLVLVFMILFIIEWWFNGCNLKIIRFFVARKYVYWECL